MGKGVIGGEMVSQKEMAKIAASMVQQYFNGTDVSSIEVQTEPPRVIMFDENVMKNMKFHQNCFLKLQSLSIMNRIF